MPFLIVEVSINAAVIGEQLAKQDQPAAEEFDKLRTQHLVAVGFLPVLHEILPGREGRIDVDEANFAARPEAVRPLLVSQQFAQG